MRAATGTSSARRVAGPMAPSAGRACRPWNALTPPSTPPPDRRVVPGRALRRGRVWQVAGHAEAAAQQRHARVVYTALERAARGDGVPPAGGRDAPVLDERAPEPRVERVARLRLLQCLIDATLLDRLLEDGHGVYAAEVALQVPVHVERLGVDFAEAE